MPDALSIPYLGELAQASAAEDILEILGRSASCGTIGHVNWEAQFPNNPPSTFAIAHDGRRLYVDFAVRCTVLRAENFVNQSPVSQDSCVEIFLRPENSDEYWNFEFNCIGAVNASHRRERNHPIRLTDTELAQIARHPSCGTRPFGEKEGAFAWNLTVAIPLALMGIGMASAPMFLRGNLYSCASRTSQPHYLSWQPIATAAPDFHRPEFFGQMVLETIT